MHLRVHHNPSPSIPLPPNAAFQRPSPSAVYEGGQSRTGRTGLRHWGEAEGRTLIEEENTGGEHRLTFNGSPDLF